MIILYLSLVFKLNFYTNIFIWLLNLTFGISL
jgi:hypothetical protein